MVVDVAQKHSDVYFFPQGFLEQASTPASFSSMVTSRPYVACRVVDVTYWGDPVTDEVFVKYRLMPLTDIHCITTSDANNGGGFSVPKNCAVSIFPTLNFEDDPPVQTLEISDVHGVKWEFRHIYRGTPRRHLFTSGWTTFVNSKYLTRNDSVIFARNKVTGDLSVGIRRHFTPLSRLPKGYVPKPPRPGVFSRSQRGRVAAEVVVEETEKAIKGLPLEVVYYPRAGLPEFVVEAHKVEQACRVNWTSGTRVRFPQNAGDGGPSVTWFIGTVTSVVPSPNDGPWPGSVWRMLQVTWDEPEKLEEVRMLSPWQVECIAPTPPPLPPTIRAAFDTPAKRLKGVQNSALLADGKGDIYFTPQLGFGSLVMDQLIPSHMNYNIFPAGMQGARQFPSIYPSNSPMIMNDDSHQGHTDDNLDSNMSPTQKVEGVSTDLNIASSSSETRSLDSLNSVQFFGAMSTGKGVTSFQLFGKIIHIEQPPANTDDISCTHAEFRGTFPL
uniref:Auxin response factor n=1 Tax=Chenopodium quinoa TaxID=63459 RepID=A0A803N2Z0_CHEQI